MMSTINSAFHFLCLVIPLLVNVAFVTLLERKILAGCQIRVGPVKTGALGLLQPFADVVKLFSNQLSLLSYMTTMIYLISPMLSIFLSMMLVFILPLNVGSLSWEFSFMLMLMILSLNVYPLMLSGWSSNSSYAILGSLRGVAQTISYEISLAFIILSLFMLTEVMSLNLLNETSQSLKYLIFPLLIAWMVSMIAELNRTPFDFSEGESELVSGFNLEYGAVKFAVFFMAEYLMIINLSLISMVLFMDYYLNLAKVYVLGLTVMMLVIWLRATLPRYRYDLLMNLAWKSLLPWSLGLVQMFSSLSLMI